MSDISLLFLAAVASERQVSFVGLQHFSYTTDLCISSDAVRTLAVVLFRESGRIHQFVVQ